MSAERLQQELNSISDNVKTTLLLTLLQPPRFNLINRSNLIIDIDSHRRFSNALTLPPRHSVVRSIF
jgi:hypothetical protein